MRGEEFHLHFKEQEKREETEEEGELPPLEEEKTFLQQETGLSVHRRGGWLVSRVSL